jgi:hypothetical protein
MRRVGIAVLGLLSLALAGIIALELRSGGQDAELAPAAPSRAAAPVQPPTPLASADQLQAWSDTILARPLFSPSRRPPAAGAAAAGAPPPALPRLAGILMDGGRRSVIFASQGERRPVVVSEGAGLDGFRVELIEAGRVTVVGPGGRQVLRPSFDPNPPPPVAVPAQAPPGQPGPPGLPGLQASPGVTGLPTPNRPSAR